MAFSGNRVPTRPHSASGEVWHASTTLVDTWTFHLIFAAETSGIGAVDWDRLALTGPEAGS
jgi:hypothetical protein